MEERLPRKLAAILYADVAGYSRLMGQDEDATHRTLSEYLDLVASTIESHRGQVMHYAGDAVLAKFDAVIDALSSAVSIQTALQLRNDDVKDECKVQFRIGLNVGDIIEDRGDIYGDGVNVAARLESLGEPGGICISEAVRTAVGPTLALGYQFLGEQKVKNIKEPVRAYRVLMATEELELPSTHAWTSQAPNKVSIAVLPFANMSGDPAQEYFSDGITEDITTDLSRVADLFVVARNSSFTYKGKSVKIQRVSEDLEVRYVLEGSVRKAGNRVRITAQLIDGTTGGHLWADRYDRELTDVFAVQSEIALSIVGALKLALAPNQERAIQQVPTVNIDAYDFYLRGREFFHRVTRKNLEFAQQMFTKAIALDSGYARAYAGMADCCSRLYQYYDSNPRHLQEGFAASTKALDLDPQLAEAHASHGLALSLDSDYEKAEREFEIALSLDSQLYEAYLFFGRSCFARGSTERAAELFKQASQVRPGDFQSLMLLGNAYRAMGRHADAKETALRSFQLAERRLELNPDDVRAAYAGAAALTDLGQRERTMEWVERALSIESEDATTYYNLACIYSLWGESERAIDCLSRALDDANISKRREWIEKDRDLDSLRAHPRFRTLVGRLQ